MVPRGHVPPPKKKKNYLYTIGSFGRQESPNTYSASPIQIQKGRTATISCCPTHDASAALPPASTGASTVQEVDASDSVFFHLGSGRQHG
ncbi:hypothetical protein MA16_Dca028644 [Dendrobium catenatum]|uniref:Uncharacterized protein n=1 Tax=Dendrobium catenatum TaxID=906689 RepID=A0A2I0VA64_9ASPA|nr:hypothetical protein MA16_Dca028644 [Dendrobium catenatum]